MSASKKWNSDLPSVKEWQDRARLKIQASNALDVALRAVNGEIELSTSRANIIRSLLDRVLPTQSQSQVEATTTQKPDFESLKQAIQASPELRNTLLALLESKPVPVEHKPKEEKPEVLQ